MVKLAIAVVIAVLIWKKGIPWIKQKIGGPESSGTTASNNSCVMAAETASERWGGVTRFGNPPYDMSAWDSFRADVNDQVRAAEQKCSCSLESCTKARMALSELRSLLSETDSMIRGNSPPPAGIVQRQEQIDETINAAKELVLQGK